MSTLKKSISKGFVLFALLLSVILSIMDSLLDEISVFITTSGQLAVALILFFMINIAIFVGIAYLFSRFLSKKVNTEAERIIEHNNLLFANIAHDLKTPLTTVIGFSRALRDGVVQDEQEAKKLLSSIVQKAEQADALLDLMFEHAKLNSAGFNLSLENVDIASLLREIVAGCYEDFEAKNIAIDVDIPESPVMVTMDKAEMHRALSNIIVNAYKHNSKGNKVLVALKIDSDSGVHLSVADDGAMIPPDKQEGIFQPFSSGDASRTGESGSGLGLSIAKDIIEKHGYMIRVKNMDKPYTKVFEIIL